MKTQSFRFLFGLMIILLSNVNLYAQFVKNTEVRFLTAKFNKSTLPKSVDVILMVSTKDTAAFPPRISLPPKCTVFEDGREKIFLINEFNLAVGLFDNKVNEKNPALYDLLKNLVDFKTFNPKKSLIIVYTIHDINIDFTKMTFRPAFREKHNQNIVTEELFTFDIK